MGKVFVKYSPNPGKPERVMIGDVIFSSDPKVEPTRFGYLVEEGFVARWRPAMVDAGFVIYDAVGVREAVSTAIERDYGLSREDVVSVLAYQEEGELFRRQADVAAEEIERLRQAQGEIISKLHDDVLALTADRDAARDDAQRLRSEMMALAGELEAQRAENAELKKKRK